MEMHEDKNGVLHPEKVDQLDRVNETEEFAWSTAILGLTKVETVSEIDDHYLKEALAEFGF